MEDGGFLHPTSPSDGPDRLLGNGKTTLLNHILTATHGKKIAVIENEFGEVGVDDELLSKNTKMQADEDIIEMMNGCICCTVRQDLIVVLEKLAKRVKATLLASPPPLSSLAASHTIAQPRRQHSDIFDTQYGVPGKPLTTQAATPGRHAQARRHHH